jgi:hypothetical protein
MLRLMLIASNTVKIKFPDADQIPNGYICPGYDLRLMQSLAVLRYIFGIKTQWSCQGNHNQTISRAYILLEPENRFPEDLVERILDAGLVVQMVGDIDINGIDTGRKRQVIRSSSILASKIIPEHLEKMNEYLLNILEKWSMEKIKEHLPKISQSKQFGTHYFDDLIDLYRDNTSS